MKFRVTNRSLSIKIVTSIVILACISLIIFSGRHTFLLILASLFALLIIWAYLLSPASYQIRNNNLIIWKNLGRKDFPNITQCSIINEKPPFTIRLFGNGGLFAGTGIFWNKKYGNFRVYVTTGKKLNMVLLNTKKGKVVISPANPKAFIEYWEKNKS